MDLPNKFKDKDTGSEQAADEILNWLKKSKIESICRDIEPLISETLEGVERISSILEYLLMKDQAALNNMIITETERAGK
jgi:flagellar motor switch protein FliG